MRVQSPKRWALDLGVEPSQVTRWASGERAFCPDDQAAAERIVMAYDRVDVVRRIRCLQDDELGHAIEAPTPCPVDTAREAGHVLAETIDGLLNAADGITLDERKDLEGLHTKLLGLARKVELLIERAP